MISYVCYAAEHHSLTIAKKTMLNTHEVTTTTLQKALTALQELGINPVTIGKNRRIASLEGLHSILGIQEGR